MLEIRNPIIGQKLRTTRDRCHAMGGLAYKRNRDPTGPFRGQERISGGRMTQSAVSALRPCLLVTRSATVLPRAYPGSLGHQRSGTGAESSLRRSSAGSRSRGSSRSAFRAETALDCHFPITGEEVGLPRSLSLCHTSLAAQGFARLPARSRARYARPGAAALRCGDGDVAGKLAGDHPKELFQ